MEICTLNCSWPCWKLLVSGKFHWSFRTGALMKGKVWCSTTCWSAQVEYHDLIDSGIHVSDVSERVCHISTVWSSYLGCSEMWSFHFIFFFCLSQLVLVPCTAESLYVDSTGLTNTSHWKLENNHYIINITHKGVIVCSSSAKWPSLMRCLFLG